MNRIASVAACLVLAAFAIVLAAIPRASRADDWLPIDPADLAMKDNPKQPGGDAMILYREVNEDAKLASVLNYKRIKVFTSAGVKSQADVEIRYNKATETVQSVRARTIHPDGRIVDFDGKTYDKEIVKGGGFKYLAKTFTMPDMEPGCIIEYKYRDQYSEQGPGSRYYWTLQWTVQQELFTRLARFSIKPDDSSYALPLFSRSYNLPASQATVQKQQNMYTLEIHDMPGIEDEQLMPPIEALQARVEFYYRSQDEPSQETQDQYWKRIGKAWNTEVDRFVDKKKELAQEVSQDVAASDSPEDKLRKLYARALKIRNLDMEDQKSAKEDKQESIKPNTNVADVLKNGYGHAIEVDWLMIGLARAAGFEAADLRVAPRSGMIFLANRQASSDLSDEMIWVRAGGKEYFLDPGARYYSFDVLPWYESAADGVRVSKDGSTMIQTPVPVPTGATIVRHGDLTVDNDMEINGTLQIDFTGLEAGNRRYYDRDEDEAGRKKVLGEEIKQWLALNSTFEVTSIKNWEQVDAPLHVEGTVKVPASSSGSVQRVLLPIEFFQTSEIGYFQSLKRSNAVVFPYPYQKVDDLVLHLPLGFKTMAVPDPQKVAPGPVSYQISAVAEADRVEIKRQLEIKGTVYSKESYPTLRNFFSIVKTDDSAPLMLQSGK